MESLHGTYHREHRNHNCTYRVFQLSSHKVHLQRPENHGQIEERNNAWKNTNNNALEKSALSLGYQQRV